VACVAVALVSAALFGCSRYSEPDEAPQPKPTLRPFVRAFALHPSIAAWDSIHRHMRLGALDQRSQAAIVDGVTQGRDVPPRLVDAVAVDLATYAWSGSMETIRRENLMARRKGSTDVLSRSAHLAWLLLALRAGYVDERVDLSGMDLRDTSRFVGQSMNLSNTDFSGSHLSGATWHNSNLTRATFGPVAIDGSLVCDSCIWRRGGNPLRKTFARGRWDP
jgi:hypothetical protein